MTITKLLYLEDFNPAGGGVNLLDFEAKVLDVLEENGKTIVVLDQTAFYPQGGGQPYDKGVIESASGKFLVEEVRFVEGVVKHIGKFENGTFSKEETVKGTVEKERRELHSRLHSAGHIVDMAVTELNLNWIPGKGYHFPEGPYVEYAGTLEGLDKEKLKNDIENLCNKFVSEGRETKLVFMAKEEMHKVVRIVPDNIPEGKPSRVVMYGDFGVPCGGTHVNNLSDIKTITIRKIKTEGTNVRVGYDVVR